MPIISVTDQGATVPGNVGRKQLHLFNEGPDNVRYGFEDVVTFNGTAATDHCFWPANSPLLLGGPDLDISGQIRVICAAGETATISYTEKG
jgi:hypothetical protein